MTRIDEKKTFKTPRAIAIWPHLVEPNTKFNPGGTYDVRVKITDQSDEQKFLEEMESMNAQAYQWNCQSQAKKTLPQELPPWKQNDEGLWEFKFKSKASYVADGKTHTIQPPKIFDSKGNLITDTKDLRIGNGSEIKVFFQIRPYFVQKAGIALRLQGVQVLRLVTYDDAARMGVEAEEGDFVAPAPTTFVMETPDGAISGQRDALVDALARSVKTMGAKESRGDALQRVQMFGTDEPFGDQF